MTYVPDRGPCYRCLFPAPPGEGLVPNCAEAGVLGVLPGVMGTIQATEAIKLIVGAGEPLIGRLLTYDALAMRFEEFRFKRHADCAVCGDNPTITVPQDAPQLCTAEALASIRTLTATEVSALLKERAGQASVVDVREPREFSASHLPGATNIPVGELHSRMGSLPKGRVIFVCRSGARSLTAAALASRAGVEDVAHLEGGLLAWARDVDATFEVAPV
jgi:adenylyltransferase/sulfurtransferase